MGITIVSNSYVGNNPDIPVKTTTDSGAKVQHVNVDNIAPGLIPVSYDFVAATYPTTTQEVYTFKTGGSGGTTVAVVTVNYTDTTKDFILDVTKV